MDTAVALHEAIGARVRHERLERGWTLEQLAAEADVSRRMLVNVEQGATNPSIGALLRLSDALGIGLPELVAPPTPPTGVRITRAGDGAVLWTGDAGGQGVLVAGTRAPDVLELWDWTLAPGERHASEAHASGTQELLQVREGVVSVEVNGEVVELGPGDAVGFRGDLPHSYASAGDQGARFALAVFEPMEQRGA